MVTNFSHYPLAFLKMLVEDNKIALADFSLRHETKLRGNKSKDKYSCLDEAGALFKSEQAL